MPARVSHGITFTGVDKMSRRMKRVYDELPQKTRDLGRRMAEQILANAKSKTPVGPTGELQASGRIIAGGISRRGAQQDFLIEFSVLNDGFDYAQIQHDEMSFHHTVGQAHYLSDAIDEFSKQSAREMLVNLALSLMRDSR